MPTLTRRRNSDAPQATWLVYYGDVRIRTIAIRSGNPADTDPWGWSGGFLSWIPSPRTSGTAATFDHARVAFEAAWRVFLSNRTEADFEAWRRQRDWTAKKYRRFDRGERMPNSAQ